MTPCGIDPAVAAAPEVSAASGGGGSFFGTPVRPAHLCLVPVRAALVVAPAARWG